MKTKNLVLLVIVCVVLAGAVIVASVGVSIYNGIVRNEEALQAAWSQVENVYQRRLDVVPNLVETVKGYAEHEQETFVQMAEARGAAADQLKTFKSKPPADQGAMKTFEDSQAQLGSSILSLWAVVESYPELKASDSFLVLQAQLEGTENRIAVERNRFNEATRAYNVGVRVFPRNLVASLGGFQARPYFKSKPNAEERIRVDFTGGED